MSHKKVFENITLEKLPDVAKALLQDMSLPCVIFLYGDLGAGKTTFARVLIQELIGKPTHVVSPTFTLLQTYDTPKGPLTHFDLYRVRHEEELFELGMDDYFHTHICLVEWPERISHPPLKRIDIYLEETSDMTRTIKIEKHP